MAKPLVSTDGSVLAFITNDGSLGVSTLTARPEDSAISVVLRLSSTLQRLISKVCMFKWSNKCENEEGGSESIRLLLAMEHQIIVLKLLLNQSSRSSPQLLGVDADVEFPVSYGRICAADFVFDGLHALIIFELAPHATILSLTRAQRDDIPNRKFAGSQTYALSHQGRGTELRTNLAVLVREKHTEYAAVMEDGKIVSSFKLDTVDAQGLMWSPDTKPVLMVWDGATHGLKVNFFSALGHPLRQLAIGTEDWIPEGLPADFAGAGVSALSWVRVGRNSSATLLALGIGTKDVLLRSLDTSSLAVHTVRLEHPSQLQTSSTTVWRHIAGNEYECLKGLWDLESSQTEEVELVTLSEDGSYIASKISSSPSVVFIWSRHQPHPAACLILEHDVRQLLWMKDLPYLVVVTADTLPCFHYWRTWKETPECVMLPRLANISFKRWRGQLVRKFSEAGGIRAKHDMLMMASTKDFDIVSLDHPNYASIFDRNGHSANTQATPELTISSNGFSSSNVTVGQGTTLPSEDGSSIFF